jgi:hypothetical protein
VLLQSPRHYRGRKARAVQLGDPEAIAEADQLLRASRIARAIEVGCAGPPLPPAIIDELRNLLPPAGAQ